MRLTPNERAARFRARKRGETVPTLQPGPKEGFKQSAEHVAKRTKRGQEHPAWKGDAVTIKGGRSRAKRKFALDVCQKCGAPATDRHHKDGNPRNNAESNIEILCEPCHIRAHGKVPRR